MFFVVLTLLFCSSRPPMNCLFHSKTLGLLFRIFTKTHRANVSLTRLIIFGYFFRKIHSFSASSITGKHVTASTTPPQATHLVSRTLEKDQSSPGINIYLTRYGHSRELNCQTLKFSFKPIITYVVTR